MSFSGWLKKAESFFASAKKVIDKPKIDTEEKSYVVPQHVNTWFELNTEKKVKYF
jgi:hypothetical protein